MNDNYSPWLVSHLYSPIFNFTGETFDPIFSFRLNYNSILNSDGLKLEMSLDDGISWNTVGSNSTGDSLFNLKSQLEFQVERTGQNWYDSTTIGWTGNSNGWKTVKTELYGSNSISRVQLRFVFTAYGQDESSSGAVIDSFSIAKGSFLFSDLFFIFFSFFFIFFGIFLMKSSGYCCSGMCD